MSPQAGLLLLNEIAPRIISALPKTVCMVGAEDAHELIQDAIALAARMLHYAESNGKKVTPGNIAYYTLQHSKSGRRSVGHSCCDVHGSATQLNGRVKLESFDYEVGFDEDTGEGITLGEVFAEEGEDPSVVAARRLDWGEFLEGQDDRGRAIVKFLDEGRSLRELAAAYKVCPSTIVHQKERIASDILSFMGNDILQRVNDKPRWNDNIHANREWMACKEERK